MFLNVKDRARCVATFRWTEVRLMEMLAAWVPTTPEMEVKLLFGAHIWDVAQHADALGKRTYELRLPLQHSIEPVAGYAALLARVAGNSDTAQRVAGFYDAVLPGLERRYRAYLGQVDQLLDNPTVRIIQRILADMDRMTAESRALLDELPAIRLGDNAWREDLQREESSLTSIVPHGDEPAATEATAGVG